MLPEKVYVQTSEVNSEMQSTVRYFNENTVLRTQIVGKLDASDNNHLIYLPGNAIIERRYIEKELKCDKKRMIVAISTKCSTYFMNRVRGCNTDYVDIIAIIPKWIKAYTIFIGWLKRIFSFKIRKQCRIMYLLALNDEE